MKNLLLFSIFLISGMWSTLSLAHPGHDHASWTSPLIHTLTFYVIGAVLVSGVIYKQILRKKKNHQEKRRES